MFDLVIAKFSDDIVHHMIYYLLTFKINLCKFYIGSNKTHFYLKGNTINLQPTIHNLLK